mmetsp:Transcript_9736/g.19097  ORF Transcript_9736/g.19097 Transcript_9736/m.19097 type:complete len:988 (+) Transcript_9736:154-3117(+)
MEDVDPEYFKDEKEFSAIPYVVNTLERSRSKAEAGARLRSQRQQVDSEGLVSVGVDEAEKSAYREDLAKIERELDSIVDGNYRGFTNSVRSFSSIFQEFTDAQRKVRLLKDYVDQSKATLVNRKRNLKQLWFQKIQQERVLELLTQLEEIKAAPRTLDQLLREERYVECVEKFQRVYGLVFGSDLSTIKALDEIQGELVSYRERIHNVLIDSLLGYLAHEDKSLGDQALTRKKKKDATGIDASQKLSSRAVLSLDSIVIALNKLGRLQTALHDVKVSLHEQLSTRIDKHMEAARRFKTPIGLAVSMHTVDDVRLKNLFREVLSDFTAIFNRHVQFAQILRREDPDLADREYAVQDTWSLIQVELQQLLELHLAAQSSFGGGLTSPSLRGANGNGSVLLSLSESNRGESFSTSANVDGEKVANTRFSFNRLRAETIEKTRAGHSSSAIVNINRTPICRPSSYRMLGLVSLLVDFSKYGDEVAHMHGKSQLLSYVNDFCKTVLMPQMQLDGLNNLQRTLHGDFALQRASDLGTDSTNPLSAEKHLSESKVPTAAEICVCRTNLGTTLCRELLRISECVESLAPIKCDLSSVIADFLTFFIEYCGEETKTILQGRLCQSWMLKLRSLLKEDPNYLALIAAGSQELDDEEKFRQAAKNFIKLERDEELKLASKLLPKVPSATSEQLLSAPLMGRLASIHGTCDLLFRSLVLTDIHDRESAMHPLFLQHMHRQRMEQIFNRPNIRSLLNKLDDIAERCLFSLRSELRVRSIISLQTLPSEMAHRDAESSTAGAALAQDLVRCARSISNTLSASHHSYVVRSLCVLLAELVLRSLRTYHEHYLSASSASNQNRSSSILSRSFGRHARKPSLGKGPSGAEDSANSVAHNPGFGKDQVQALVESLVVLQQTMWTILLNSYDAALTGHGATQAQTRPFKAARDQLGAFDGARRFLLCFENPPDGAELEQVINFTSESMLGALTSNELASALQLFQL